MKASYLALLALSGCCLQAANEADGKDAGSVDAGAADAGRVPIPNPCFILDPPTVDLGVVEVYSTGTKSLSLTNACGVELIVTIGTLKGTDPLLFGTVPAAGTVLVLQDQETTSLEIQYTPLVPSSTENTAYVSMKLCSSVTGCERLVSLRGTAVPLCLGLAVDPSTLDFGFVPPGTSVVKAVALSNCYNGTIRLIADPIVLNSGSSTNGAFQPGAGFPTKDIVIPPGQSVQIPVVFTPLSTGKFLGELDVSTDDAQSSNITIPLTGFGGGAAISCTPTPADFGVAAVGFGTTVRIVCTNVGTAIPGHPEANLFIPDPSSGKPALTLQGGDTAFVPMALDFPPAGLVPGESIAFQVEYDPIVAGTDTDTLAISSNGANGADTLIPLTGEAKVLPDCNYRIQPMNLLLDLGTVGLGAHANLVIEIDNQGADDCIVSGFSLDPESSPAFSLPDFVGHPSTSQTIPPDGHARVSVRFAPTAVGLDRGTVHFGISSSSNPVGPVDVIGRGQ